MQIFSQEKPIYLQIYDRICNEILSGRLREHSRIPSVRDYGALLQVNANTAVKAYEQLSRDNIIFQKRGMGCCRGRKGTHHRTAAHNPDGRHSAASLPRYAASRRLHRRHRGRISEIS